MAKNANIGTVIAETRKVKDVSVVSDQATNVSSKFTCILTIYTWTD